MIFSLLRIETSTWIKEGSLHALGTVAGEGLLISPHGIERRIVLSEGTQRGDNQEFGVGAWSRPRDETEILRTDPDLTELANGGGGSDLPACCV